MQTLKLLSQVREYCLLKTLLKVCEHIFLYSGLSQYCKKKNILSCGRWGMYIITRTSVDLYDVSTGFGKPIRQQASIKL